MVTVTVRGNDLKEMCIVFWGLFARDFVLLSEVRRKLILDS